MSTKEQKEPIELLQGTLDLLILRTLQLGPAHGHAIAKAIEFKSDDVLKVECQWRNESGPLWRSSVGRTAEARWR
jgi:hypothetical protein